MWCARSECLQEGINWGVNICNCLFVLTTTDLPTIISGPVIAFMEPQGKVWPGRSGRQYAITSPKMRSTLAPFEGISGFSAALSTYPHTLFRFPLRVRASGLSQTCYDVSKLRELLEALKEEAQCLLLFLRSVDIITVIEIGTSGVQSKVFEVSIMESEREIVSEKRRKFLQEVKSSNLKTRKATYMISYEAKFHVTADDIVAGEVECKHWLVTTTVGSDRSEDLQAAAKQKVLPWVGCALELEAEIVDDSGGRIFCFLPLPQETRSPLPVHVNGTFGLNDDRRSLKWPSGERKHDLTADWNMIIVQSLLPHCYSLLIKSAIIENVPSDVVYKSWPQCKKLKRTPWSGLSQPLFENIFKLEVFWSKEYPDTDQGMWVSLKTATVVLSEISSVVHKVLSACGLQLVDFRDYPHISDALLRVGSIRINELTPVLARQKIRFQKGMKYQALPPSDKHELLHYCLSDEKFNELEGLELLPLVNGSFVSFAQGKSNVNPCYVCNEKNQRGLLPNLEHCLVDVSSHNLSLNKELLRVASSNKTQLQKLNSAIVSELLPKCMPPEWSRETIASVSGIFPAGWFEMFWEWVTKYSIDLDLFKDKMVIIPVVKSCSQKSDLCIARLMSKSSVIFISEYSVLTNDKNLIGGLQKLDVYFTGTTENLFPYLQHCNSLRQYVNSTTPHSVLNAIANAYCDEQFHRLHSVRFTKEEAESMQHFFADPHHFEPHQKEVLMHLPIIKCVNREILQSIATAADESWKQRAVMIMNSDSSFESNPDLLPPNLVVLYCTHDQKTLVHFFLDMVARIDRVDFILEFIFPMIMSSNYPKSKIECLMEEILEELPSLKSEAKRRMSSLLHGIRNVPFLKGNSKGSLVPPTDLFDPSKELLAAMLQGEPVFPRPPFNKTHLIPHLRECGLRQKVTAKEIVKVIISISSKPATAVEVSRAKAVLDYLDSNRRLLEESVHYKSSNVQLQKALKDISEKKKWLPVQVDPPEYYPSCLEWKGKSCTTLLVSLGSETLVCSPNNQKRDSLKVGSAMHLVPCQPSLSSVLRSVLRVKHVIKHFKEVIKCSDKLGEDEMDMIIDHVYEFLQRKTESYSELKTSLPSCWIWIRKVRKFLSTKSVSIERNPSLKQDLEPYVYVLPEALQKYSELFRAMGVKQCITESQLLNVLTTIKNIKDLSQSDSKEVWATVMGILSSLTSHGTQPLNLKSRDILYVPIESENLCLEDSRKVCYADFDFLQEFVASKDESDSTENEDSYVLCHDRIKHMAQYLHLTPLSVHYDISEDLFDDFGPHEPLVLRLKNILRDYTDGLTIVKELIQNADDAEATVVNLCYDARQHDVNPKNLLYSGMAECNGPALIVHNDAMFTNEDFLNITKLAAATKQNKPLKIGKFGIGFCSVYHITDVPSFVSREYLYIFDPTLQYLGKHIRDKSRPGKRLKFTQKIAVFSKQLVPFVGLNEFQSKKPFKGTMFRFPFRKCGSEISPIQYTEQHIEQLIEDIQKSGPKLLLFLQNVKRITFSRIDESDESPKVLLDIHKEAVPSVTVDTHMLSIHTVKPTDEADLSHWLVGSYAEKLYFSGQERDATASVACLMQSTSSESHRYSVIPVSGEVFCFLPLSLQSGLPVHVSANFSVLNDRTGIRSSEQKGTGANEAEWNEDLLKDGVSKAYLYLLQCLSKMHTEGNIEKEGYVFYSLWPLKTKLKVHNPWDTLIAPLYYGFADENKLLYSEYVKSWLTLSECQFMSPDVLSLKRLQVQDRIPVCVQESVKILKINVVDLPHYYQQHLPKHSTLQELDFVNFFFQRIHELEAHCDIRNSVLQRIIQMYTLCEWDERAKLEKILQGNRCIPCTPNGAVLKHCTSVMDHAAFFAELYEPSDGVFPIEEFQNSPTNQALIDLGMIKEILPLCHVAERAETVEALYSSDQMKALKRSELVLKCVSRYIEKSGRSSYTHPLTDTHATHRTSPYSSQHGAQYAYSIPPTQCKDTERLKATKFLPVKQRPTDYPAALSWKGDYHATLAANEIYYSELCANLAGSQICVVCTDSPAAERGGCGAVEDRVITKLGMRTMPEFRDVVKHFCHIIRECTSQEGTENVLEETFNTQWVTSICFEIYSFLEEQLQKNRSLDLSALSGLPCVWTGSCFVQPSLVASEWTQNGPYLFQIPSNLASKKHMVAALNIKTQFSVKDLAETLKRIKEKYMCEPVNKKCQEFLVILVTKLGLRMEQERLTDGRDLICYLPDSNFVMQRAGELDYNDAEWCKDDVTTGSFVHSSISKDIAINLGVRPVRAKFLDNYEDDYEGEEFGQNEDLTQRIKNILQDYPLDITILKELLQNADDARATKMFVILDKREHGLSKLPSDEWKDLQGPALLVWNDSTFCEKDLKGIQKLGLGSKRSESETIGMYGIGFNVVYHLTDCPSFISTEEDGKSTLCVLDPHCRYIPGAKKLKPGRRFNNLDHKFWKLWSDLRPAYLQDDTSGLPKEIKKGSLFRFPLRHSQELVANSELVVEHVPMPAWKMEKNLKEWAPDMRETLFFLNNVTELQFYVIDDSNIYRTQYYNVTIDDTGKKCRDRMQKRMHNFSAGNPTPHLESYTLTLTDTAKGRHKGREPEKWLIQQGVGDIHNPHQHWQYLPRMKPKHGIAAPLCASDRPTNMRVFCFLPLPIMSHLPVHINGSFVLHSSRRQLWQPTSSYKDDKKRWNVNLIEAIASSYARLLVTIQRTFIAPSEEVTKDALLQSVHKYYNTFPVWLPQCGYAPEGECLILAKTVYNKLHQQNSSILIHVNVVNEDTCRVDYLPLKNDNKPQDQPYFYDRSLSVELVHTLQKIGMRLTEAPVLLYRHFCDQNIELCMVTERSVFEYFSKFNSQVFPTASAAPALITETKFESVEDFKVFTKYILEPSEDDAKSRQFQFPMSPFGIPLLLTADNHLRKFDSNNKPIQTKFSALFPEISDKFLHPELMDVKYLKDYFLKPSADKHWDVVHSIMLHTLPEKLQCSVVSDASACLNRDVLTEIWKCLSEDEFFIVHLKRIIQAWALIPSTTNQLFSLSCTLLPIMKGTEDQQPASSYGSRAYNSSQYNLSRECISSIFTILKRIGMPIVDLDIVPSILARQFCPQDSNPTAIIKNLYYLHQKRKVLDNTASIEPIVKSLLEYFGTIHLSYDTESLSKVKALPLFKNIDGRFCSIPGGAFIWPEDVCEAGKEVWLQGDVHVFLTADGDWTCLKANQALGITPISPFKLYNEFIFPTFHKLTRKQRMLHLEKIRDSLFENAEHSKNSLYSKDINAEKFLKGLTKLCFLPRADGTLGPVHDFAHPKKTIFTTFDKHFTFPPADMQDDKWLSFLKKIGLRTTITTKEYLQFCFEVHAGKHSRLKPASLALVDYLFQEKEWHNEQYFLGQVSNIAFVCVDPLPGVNWIQSCAPPEQIIQPHGSDVVQLTSLARAADYKDYRLVWTVKPVVHLPSYPEHSFQLAKQKRHALLQFLRVSKTTTETVVKNIKNISSTRFADFHNFETYSCPKRPKDGEYIEDVLSENLEFLRDFSSLNVHVDLSPLKNVPCIPVCAEGNINAIVHPVLVKPVQVIALASELVCQFMPFLNRLPNDLYSFLPHVLAPIGVEQEIMLKHVQGALETIHTCTELQPLDVNTQKAVQNLIRKLYELLNNQQKSANSKSICEKTLYLPNSDYILVDSRTLLYQDSEHFRKKALDFKESKYSELHLLVHKNDVISHYRFHVKDLCNLLPSAIAPKPLSTSCNEVMSTDCRVETALSPLAQGLSRAFKLPLLAAGACAILKHNSNPLEMCQDLKSSLEVFFKNCELYTVKNLKVDLWLEVEQPHMCIGKAEVDFHIKENGRIFCLYIDKDARKILFFEALSLAILSLAAEMSKVNMKDIKEPEKALTHLLKAESSDEVKSTLRELGVDEGVSTGKSDDFTEQFDPNLSPELGSRIPESWHHRLQQDYNNIFRPGEWVGYEVEDDIIVFASIGYKIDNTDTEGFASYYIYLNEDEQEGEEVSVFAIYKILRSKAKKQEYQTNVQMLVVYEGTSEESKPKSFIEIKKEICEELKRIWKLPEDLRKKAIRRMYLKWHPDKNPDNIALSEEAFKFLKQQIARLEQGKAVNDPDQPEEDESSAYDHTSSSWESFFRQWNFTARSHSHYQQSEWRQYSHFSSSKSDRSSHYDSNFSSFAGPTPDLHKAQVWIKQAECDYKALSILSNEMSTATEVCANVCFLAHEVAEKSLKAGMLAVWGLQAKDFTNHKKLHDYACNLEMKRPQLSDMGLQAHVLDLPTDKFYYQTRWPNKYSLHKVPAEHFDEGMATEACSHALAILDMVKTIIVEESN